MHRCIPVPDTDVFCRTTFRYSHYSTAIAAQIRMHIARVSFLSSNTSTPQECTDFFGFYQCIGTLTPCNKTSMKIYTICQDTCNMVTSLLTKCLDFTRIDPLLLEYFANFNCSNPLTYSSSLTLEYYEPPNDEICNALSEHFG